MMDELKPISNSLLIHEPKVTFVLYAYNEEKYIAEAVRSALAQTYSPMEIVLSDDGSSDGTFRIMERMAAEYSGPHRIILNRNRQNIGIGSQLNAAVEKSEGELILLANGDDVSLPERTVRTVEAWLGSDRTAQAITTDLLKMDEHGAPIRGILNGATLFKDLEDGMRKRFGGVLAASLAISRVAFERFGALLPSLILEDNVLYLRAVLTGPTLHLRDPLVIYRIHRDNISQAYSYDDFATWSARHRRKNLWHREEAVKAYLQMLTDLYRGNQVARWPARDVRRARWVAIEKLVENAMLRDYLADVPEAGLADWWKALGRLFLLLLKATIKTGFPAIEERNARWHHRKWFGGSVRD